MIGGGYIERNEMNLPVHVVFWLETGSHIDSLLRCPFMLLEVFGSQKLISFLCLATLLFFVICHCWYQYFSLLGTMSLDNSPLNTVHFCWYVSGCLCGRVWKPGRVEQIHGTRYKFWRLDVTVELYSGYGKGYLWRKRSTKAKRELHIPDGTDAMRSFWKRSKWWYVGWLGGVFVYLNAFWWEQLYFDILCYFSVTKWCAIDCHGKILKFLYWHVQYLSSIWLPCCYNGFR